jgi:hypothetical protein
VNIELPWVAEENGAVDTKAGFLANSILVDELPLVANGTS